MTGNEITLTCFPSSALLPGGNDSTDIDMRGKELATRCWNEDEDFLAKAKIAEWLGGPCVLHDTVPGRMLIYFSGHISKSASRHYIDFFANPGYTCEGETFKTARNKSAQAPVSFAIATG